MRRAMDSLVWVAILATVWAVCYVASAPDVDASLGVPACASRPDHVSCRYCGDHGRSSLPKEIDGQNVRCIVPEVKHPAQVVAQK
jgi:hypothetical protein